MDGEDAKSIAEYSRARHRLVVIWSWVGGILLAAVGIFVAGVLAIPIGIIIWTAIIVFILAGPVNFFEEHGMSRMVGTIIAFVLLILVLGVLLFLIFSPAFGIDTQFEELAKSLPGYFQAFSDWVNDFYKSHADLFENETVKNALDDAYNALVHWLQDTASSGANGLVAVGTSIVNVFICVGFALVAAFWMLIELPNLGREAYRLIGRKRHEDAEMLHITVTRVMGGYLRTTIIQCAIIGIACGIMFAILGVPSPAAFGVITGLLNIIPIIGPWLGGGLAFVASFIESPLVGIIALAGTVIIQQIVYTFISPKLMGDSVDIHPALTFIALTAGAAIGTAMGGVMGALIGSLLSIPAIAMIKSVFVYYFEKNTGRRIISEDGVFFKGVPASGSAPDPLVDATNPGMKGVQSRPNALHRALRRIGRKTTGSDDGSKSHGKASDPKSDDHKGDPGSSGSAS